MSNTMAESVSHLARMASISEATIGRWIRTSEEFRAMFEDYMACREMVRTWRSSQARRDAKLVEFEKLSRQLEASVVRFIQEHSGQDELPQAAEQQSNETQ